MEVKEVSQNGNKKEEPRFTLVEWQLKSGIEISNADNIKHKYSYTLTEEEFKKILDSEKVVKVVRAMGQAEQYLKDSADWESIRASESQIDDAIKRGILPQKSDQVAYVLMPKGLIEDVSFPIEEESTYYANQLLEDTSYMVIPTANEEYIARCEEINAEKLNEAMEFITAISFTKDIFGNSEEIDEEYKDYINSIIYEDAPPEEEDHFIMWDGTYDEIKAEEFEKLYDDIPLEEYDKMIPPEGPGYFSISSDEFDEKAADEYYNTMAEYSAPIPEEEPRGEEMFFSGELEDIDESAIAQANKEYDEYSQYLKEHPELDVPPEDTGGVYIDPELGFYENDITTVPIIDTPLLNTVEDGCTYPELFAVGKEMVRDSIEETNDINIKYTKEGLNYGER